MTRVYIYYTVILKAVILNIAHPVRINSVSVYCSTFIKLILIKNDINEEFQMIQLLLGCLHDMGKPLQLCLYAPCHYFDLKYCNIIYCFPAVSSLFSWQQQHKTSDSHTVGLFVAAVFICCFKCKTVLGSCLSE